MTPTTDIVPGTLVHLKPHNVGRLGIDQTLLGGEARVLSVEIDARGPYYRVEVLRSGAIRFARREGLVIHRDRKASGADR